MKRCLQLFLQIGIVGRTGAGKSSLITALFRLSHIRGDIYIDGQNTASLPLSTLRKSFSIIPQVIILLLLELFFLYLFLSLMNRNIFRIQSSSQGL